MRHKAIWPMIAAASIALGGCGSESAEKATSAGSPRVPAQFQQLASGPVATGERLSRVLGCQGCHGAELQGQDWFEDAELGVLHSSNLTRAVAHYDDAGLRRAIQNGVRADGTPLWDMPSHIFTQLSDADMRAIIAYLRTLEPAGPVPPPMSLGPEGRRLLATGELKPEPEFVRERSAFSPPAVAGDHDWARYMIRATCSECHGMDINGQTGPKGTIPALTIVSAYSRPQFHHLLRTGEPVGGRQLRLMDAVSRNRFSQLSDAEVDAIYDYLSALAARPQ